MALNFKINWLVAFRLRIWYVWEMTVDGSLIPMLTSLFGSSLCFLSCFLSLNKLLQGLFWRLYKEEGLGWPYNQSVGLIVLDEAFQKPWKAQQESERQGKSSGIRFFGHADARSVSKLFYFTNGFIYFKFFQQPLEAGHCGKARADHGGKCVSRLTQSFHFVC